MMDILARLFAAVCSQDPSHTWAPGGILLPCCQRCLGLYVGAGAAALLHLWLRPKLSGRFLEVHGAFLLGMIPFGFHWVEQGPVVRTLTGALFGFGVVTFLWLPLSQRAGGQRTWTVAGKAISNRLRSAMYASFLAGTLVVLPAAARAGGTSAAYGLSGMAVWGAVMLGALVIGNVGLGCLGALRLLQRFARPHSQP